MDVDKHLFYLLNLVFLNFNQIKGIIMKIKILILIPILLIAGCATRYDNPSKFHQIAANTNGNYLSLYDSPLDL
jgi:hypothetical protein